MIRKSFGSAAERDQAQLGYDAISAIGSPRMCALARADNMGCYPTKDWETETFAERPIHPPGNSPGRVTPHGGLMLGGLIVLP